MWDFSPSLNALTYNWMLSPRQGPKSDVIQEMSAEMEKNQLWLRKNKRKAFYAGVISENFREGTETLLQVSIGTLYTIYLWQIRIKNNQLV